MVLPNFFCAGAQKAGTTTLHNILRQHPDIYLPPDKEAWFFHWDEKYASGLPWYEATYFNQYANQRAIGEITPEYMYFKNTAQRIFSDLGPNIKFIFSLRNPVERAYSHYLMIRRRGREELSFEAAIAAEKQRIGGSFRDRVEYSYMSRGFYSLQIERYLNLFPPENMLFLVFEKDIRQHIEATVKRILSFLGVEEVPLNCDIKSNPASTPRNRFLRDLVYRPGIIKRCLKPFFPSKGLRWQLRHAIDRLNQVPLQKAALEPTLKKRLLADHFMPDIERLEKIIGRGLNVWYDDIST